MKCLISYKDIPERLVTLGQVVSENEMYKQTTINEISLVQASQISIMNVPKNSNEKKLLKVAFKHRSSLTPKNNKYIPLFRR